MWAATCDICRAESQFVRSVWNSRDQQSLWRPKMQQNVICDVVQLKFPAGLCWPIRLDWSSQDSCSYVGAQRWRASSSLICWPTSRQASRVSSYKTTATHIRVLQNHNMSQSCTVRQKQWEIWNLENFEELKGTWMKTSSLLFNKMMTEVIQSSSLHANSS